MKKIYLFWFQYEEGNGNFGDELNPYIVKGLSKEGTEIIAVPRLFLSKTRLQLLRLVVRKLRSKEYSSVKNLTSSIEYNLMFNRVLIAIGSIISFHTSSNCYIWGSGLISKNNTISPAKILAVRGMATKKRLAQLNLPHNHVKVGDPAVLLPLIYTPKKTGTGKIGLIPHYVQFEKTRQMFSQRNNIIVINLLDDVEKIIDQIADCSFTLSSSLHGIIVSHSYGVPSQWVNFSDNKLYGDNIKFEDYYSSVNMGTPSPENVTEDTLPKILERCFSEDNISNVLPDAGQIQNLQNGLLEVAPFVLKNKFKR